jgi:RNA polymerase sigma-70 factor (ECF subfamily)
MPPLRPGPRPCGVVRDDRGAPPRCRPGPLRTAGGRSRTRSHQSVFDEVSETVEGPLQREALPRCLKGLSFLQRESVLVAYYEGCTYRETAERLGVALGTIKTRMRDGLIRLRDCLQVA